MMASYLLASIELNSWVQNTVTVGVLGLIVWIVLAVRRSRYLLESFSLVFKRRKVAACLLGVYVSLALIDSIVWVGGDPDQDGIAAHQPRSYFDRSLGARREKSYSAPFAASEFYDGTPLKYPHTHPLGTNILGQDVLYLCIKGSKVALLVGGLTSLIAIPLALLFGVLAGYFGGRLDDLVFLLTSTLASMPSILLLIALIMVLGQGTLSVCLALGITSWVSFARLARGETMKLREMDYVAASRVLGASHRHVIMTHIVPNLIHLVVITFVLMFSGLVLSEATLSWLGIGVDGSWGQMIAQAKDELSREPMVWWNVAFATAASFGLLLSVNLIGDALRDVLDPKTRTQERAL